MDKQEFIKRVTVLSEYSDKERQLSDILCICDSNFVSELINDMGDMLITAVNHNLTGLTEDYFYETFWNMLDEADAGDWSSFYDALSKGAADPEYIKRYS